MTEIQKNSCAFSPNWNCVNACASFRCISRAFLVALLVLALPSCSQKPQSVPPTVLFGGEMHNSNASTPESIDSSMDIAQALGYNCVLAPVSWAQTEVAPGVFDFSLVDHLLKAADKRNLYLGLLWFGTWKNGESSYPPQWIRNQSEYAIGPDGTASTAISPFCDTALEADKAAFSALMAHLNKADRSRRVLNIQVENECGAFIERDCSPAALKAWEEGGWSQSDDPLAPQKFMAEAFAKYVDAVAAAGKAQYDIPVFANAWLAPADKPYNKYPNGGPRVAVLDVWKANAPHLDWLSPDIYDKGFALICEAYSQGQDLFIPETSRQAGRYYYAVGEAKAKGVFCFGYEESYDDSYYVQECRVFSELLPYLQKGYPTRGFFREPNLHAEDELFSLELEGVSFDVHCIGGEKNAHGIIIKTAPDEYIIAGVGAWIDIKLASCEEIRDGKVWQVLNGDETGHHNMLYLRGRLYQEDFTAPDGTVIPAPMYGLSYQRRFKAAAHERFKVSGIYRVRIM